MECSLNRDKEDEENIDEESKSPLLKQDPTPTKNRYDYSKKPTEASNSKEEKKEPPKSSNVNSSNKTLSAANDVRA